ncbi:MAG: 4Fe-4S dicluster domain-containing protein [Thiotrichaceae bacterium]|nr:4Fe-4S dicluster domain-containing protein [Thiotrichaceae bacterium]
MAKPKLTRKQKARRQFLSSVGYTVAITSAALAGYIPIISNASHRLRPPGALAEKAFLSSCIKCGQCVQVCPVKAIKLADIDDGFGIGSPYIDAREQACDFSCDGLQCVLACPTGSLTHSIDYPAQTNMGVAKLNVPKLCLAVQGQGFKGKTRHNENYQGILRFEAIDRWYPVPLADQEFDLEICDLCVRLCPIEIRANQCDAGNPPAGDESQCPPRAIKLVEFKGNDGTKRMKPEILDGCVGCGVCEMVCPTQPSAIVIEINKDRDLGKNQWMPDANKVKTVKELK